jgi:hypothetical protein
MATSRDELVREAAAWLSREAWPQADRRWVRAMAEDLVDCLGSAEPRS